MFVFYLLQRSCLLITKKLCSIQNRSWHENVENGYIILVQFSNNN